MASIEFKCIKCGSTNIKIEKVKTMGCKEVDALIIFFVKCTDCENLNELLMYNE